MDLNAVQSQFITFNSCSLDTAHSARNPGFIFDERIFFLTKYQLYLNPATHISVNFSTFDHVLISSVTKVGVTRGGNWGGHPYFFFLKNWRPFFAHHCHFYWFYSGVSPIEGVIPHLFYLSDLVCPLFFLSPQIFFVRVSPHGGCHPGRSAPAP